MKVRITKASIEWYRNHIGKTFSVKPTKQYDNLYVVKDNDANRKKIGDEYKKKSIFYINKDNCEIVKKPKKDIIDFTGADKYPIHKLKKPLPQWMCGMLRKMEYDKKGMELLDEFEKQQKDIAERAKAWEDWERQTYLNKQKMVTKEGNNWVLGEFKPSDNRRVLVKIMIPTHSFITEKPFSVVVTIGYYSHTISSWFVDGSLLKEGNKVTGWMELPKP